MQIGAVTNYSYSSKIKNIGQNANPTPASNSKNIFSPSDKVEITDKKLKLDKLFGNAGKDGKITLDEIQKLTDSDLADVKTMFSELAGILGIDPQSEISLYKDSAGKIKVKGSINDKSVLEEYLNSNDEFFQKFSRLSTNSSMLSAAKEAQNFQAAYAKNPAKAVAQFKYLFNNNQKWDFMLKISNTQFVPEINADI